MADHFVNIGHDLVDPPSSVNSHLKTARAKEHLDALKVEIDTFSASKPCAVTADEYSERDGQKLQIVIQPVPRKAGLLLGDFISCLRASLDHLAWQLALLTTQSPARTNQFPIFQDLNGDKAKRYRAAVKDIPTEAEAIIESLQPYHRGNAFTDAPLWQISTLCNVDKHREIPIHSSVANTVWAPIAGRIRSADSRGAVIAVRPGEKRGVTFNPYPPVEIVFGHRLIGAEFKYPQLVAMHKFVCDNVIPQFERFFSNPEKT